MKGDGKVRVVDGKQRIYIKKLRVRGAYTALGICTPRGVAS